MIDVCRTFVFLDFFCHGSSKVMHIHLQMSTSFKILRAKKNTFEQGGAIRYCSGLQPEYPVIHSTQRPTDAHYTLNREIFEFFFQNDALVKPAGTVAIALNRDSLCERA